MTRKIQRTLPTTKHVQVEQSFERGRTFQQDNSKRGNPLNAKIMEFIALDNQPFSVVYHRLVEHLEPWYTLSSRRYSSGVVLPELHSIVETHIHELLAMGVTAICFTTDIRTSDVSLMSLTAYAQECAG
jgi:hypothetical protein